jgi:Big-like domain-containing protein
MRLNKPSLWLSTLLVLGGCPGNEENEPRLSVVTVTCDPASVVAGQFSQCTASATDQDGKPFAVSSYTWTSSDESVATVESMGKVTTLPSGTTTIRTTDISASATVDGVTQQGKATLTVTPQPARLSAVTVTCNPASVPATRPSQCSASATDQYGQPFAVSGYTWTSSDESVAKVGSTGKVTTFTTGTATLRASATTDGVTHQGQASLSVTEAQPTLHSTPITANETWSEANNPHVVQGTIEVGGTSSPTLTLSAGTMVRFGSGAMLRVGETEPGGLIVDGTADSPVLLTADSTSPQPGHWKGVHLTHHLTSPSRISHATIEYAGVGGSTFVGTGNLNLYGWDSTVAPGAVIEHVVARKSSGSGFYLGYGGNIGSGSTGLIARDNDGFAISARANHIGGIPTGTTVSGNGRNAVEVLEYLAHPQTWPNLGIPYVVNESFSLQGTLTLRPGTEVRFAADRILSIGNQGPAALIAIGTAEAPIRFVPDSATPTKGHWRGLHFWNASGSQLDHVIVTHAGATGTSYTYSNVNVHQEIGAFLTNSTLSDSLGCGVTRSDGNRPDTTVVTTNFTLATYNNTFVNNDAGAQCTN